MVSKTLLALTSSRAPRGNQQSWEFPPMPNSTHHGQHTIQNLPGLRDALFHLHNAPASGRKRAPPPKPMYSTFYFYRCHVDFTTSSYSLSTLPSISQFFTLVHCAIFMSSSKGWLSSPPFSGTMCRQVCLRPQCKQRRTR